MTETNRGSFGSKIGLILATAGGAVGLGNVWRFPYMAGQEGGAAFILVYIHIRTIPYQLDRSYMPLK